MGEAAKYSALGTSDGSANAPAASVAVVFADSEVTVDDGAVAAGHVQRAVPVVSVATTRTDRVEVIAPASLPGGYELHCDFLGKSVVVQVPPEGVKQGQQFVADVIRLGDADADPSGHRIPTGKWRDGICDCFSAGVCHPMLWLACCCRPLAIGQVMTRVGLTATGAPIPKDANGRETAAGRMSAFQVVAFIFAVFLVVDYALWYAWTPFKAEMRTTYDQDGHATPPDYSSIPGWVLAVRGTQGAIKLVFGMYMLVLLIRTRAHVRRRHGIPESCCTGGCEDCCCSFWLPCCTTLQIARHTADYDTYLAACCSGTGLDPHAPQVV